MRYDTWPAICVDRTALTLTSPEDQTTSGSSFGSKVIVSISGRAARRALLDLGVALSNLAGLDECIGDVADKLPAAHSEALRRNDIGAADRVDLWPGAIERPTQLDEVREALGMIIVHMRKENRIELLRPDPELRQPHRSAAACVELHLHSSAVIAIIAITHKRSGTG
jgi:hypothetical protein